MSNETDKLVGDKLTSWGIKFEATGGTLTKRDDWDCYAWQVHFARVRNGKRLTMLQPYYCGLAHVTKPKSSYISPKPIAPTSASVLYSMLSDANAIDQSFTDWAGDFGYDTDSRKALATYEACCDIGREMRAFFSADERTELQTMLQDY